MKRYNLTALLEKRNLTKSESAIMAHMIISGCSNARELPDGTIKYQHNQDGINVLSITAVR